MTTLRDRIRGTAPQTAPRHPMGETGRETRMRAHARTRIGGLRPVWQRLCAITLGEDTRWWTEPLPSPAAMLRYAKHGAWHNKPDGVLRRAGVVYAFAAALITVMVVGGVWAFLTVLRRPARMAAALFLFTVVKIFI